MMKKADIKTFFARLAEHESEPQTELIYTNPFTLLVAVVLSAQATDKGVNRATATLFQEADTPQKMAGLGVNKITEHIKTIGLYRNKAKNVVALSEILRDDYNGEIPNTRDALMTLPGVGRKTANVVLNVLGLAVTFPVDTHVFRVSNRTGLARGKNVDAIEVGLEKSVPEPYRQNAHHWLILHGRYVCVARRPKCHICIVRDLCGYGDKTEI